MVTVLITFICITLAGATAAAAFVFGRQVGYTKRDNEVLRVDMQTLNERIEQMTLEYMQLETQYKQDKRDNQRPINPGSWDPGQISARG